jgi:SAM-dependent methyltransferase
MTRDAKITIGLERWLCTPPGRYLLEWEQRQLDGSVADVFGFHALQLGLPEVDALRANRMPHRWLATDDALPRPPVPPLDAADGPPAARAAVVLHCDFDALPFPNQSLDLVVLPHALELARDAHEALREVERVLMPEGRVVIVGFNPTSLWGLRRRVGHWRWRMSFGRGRPPFMPDTGPAIGYWRLRDWLRLLSFDIEGGRFGGWRPPIASQRWLSRFAWMDAAGERWWPVLGAVYLLVAVKRVRGMRVIGLARNDRKKVPAAPAVVTNRHQREDGA